MINIKYAQIRSIDISNGESIGVALFVQGCYFKCYNCFNSETWDFNSGKEWTKEIQNTFLELADKPYINRISLLGGECLADKNVKDILELVKQIRNKFGNTKKIWLYTGYVFEDIWNINTELDTTRQMIIKDVDILVDGRFIDSLKDLTLKFRGSSNQRIIDVKETLKHNKIIKLYED